MTRILAALALLLAISACDTVKGLVPSLAAKTPAQHMMALEVEYNGVFALMKQYEDLSRCSPAGSKICSDQGAVNRMRAINTAFDDTSATAWKVIRQAGASSDAKDAAVAAVVAIVADARTLFESVSAVLASFKEGA